MLNSFARGAFCALLIICCAILVQAEPIYRRPYRAPRDTYDDRTVAAAFQSLSFKFWNSVSERSIDIKHDLGVPPQHDPRYQLIKRQGGTGIVTNSTPSVTPTPTPTDDTSTDEPPVTTDVEPTETSDVPSVTTTPSSGSTPQTTPAETTPPSTSEDAPTTEPSEPTTTEVPTVTTPTSAFTSTFVGTTTDAEGDLITYTSVVLVQPTRTGGNATPTNGKPGLQTNGASAPVNMKNEMLAMFGGVVAIAMAL